MKPNITPEQRRALATQVGLHEQYLYQCLSGRRDMGAAEAVRVERKSQGALTRQMLCQRSWSQLWPELALVSLPPQACAAA